MELQQLLEVFAQEAPASPSEYRTWMWQATGALLRAVGGQQRTESNDVTLEQQNPENVLNMSTVKREMGYHLLPAYPKFRLTKVGSWIFVFVLNASESSPLYAHLSCNCGHDNPSTASKS